MENMREKIDHAIEQISEKPGLLMSLMRTLAPGLHALDDAQFLDEAMYMKKNLVQKVPSLVEKDFYLKEDTLSAIVMSLVVPGLSEQRLEVMVKVFAGYMDLVQANIEREANVLMLKQTQPEQDATLMEKIMFFVSQHKNNAEIFHSPIHLLIPPLLNAGNESFGQALGYFAQQLKEQMPSLFFNDENPAWILKNDVKKQLLSSLLESGDWPMQMLEVFAKSLDHIKPHQSPQLLISPQVQEQVVQIIENLPPNPHHEFTETFLNNPPVSRYAGFKALKPEVQQMQDDELVSLISFIRDTLEKNGILKIDCLKPQKNKYEHLDTDLVLLHVSLYEMADAMEDKRVRALIQNTIKHLGDYAGQHAQEVASSIFQKYKTRDDKEESLQEYIDVYHHYLCTGKTTVEDFFASISDELVMLNNKQLHNVVQYFLNKVEQPHSVLAEEYNGIKPLYRQQLFTAFSSHARFDAKRAKVFSDVFVDGSPSHGQELKSQSSTRPRLK